jgi:hypothetical protein
MTEANEIERLRARVAELEAQLTVDTTATKASKSDGGRRSGWWAVGSGVLITLACVLAPLSVTAVWASMELSDTEQYVETVAPLADNSAVQAAVASEVTAQVLENLDVEQLTTEALEILAQQENVPPSVSEALPALAVPITNGFENFTRTQVGNIIASPEFAAVWASVNRIAHEQVVKLLEGNEGGAVSAQDNTITLNLAPIIAAVKQQLIAQGFALANNIPVVDTSFVLVESDTITQAQGFYRLLTTLGTWLPLIVLALLAIGVVLARDRRRALMRGALGVAAAMVFLGVVLAIGRMLYVQSTPADILTEEAAGQVFDALVRFLRTGVRAVAILGLVVALAAFLAGPSAASVRTRTAFKGGIGSLRSGAEDAGWQTGRVGTWTYANKTRLRIGSVIAGGMVLMFWTVPTVGVVLLTAALICLVLAVIEFIGRPPHPPVGISVPGADQSETTTVPTQRRPAPLETSAESSERDDAAKAART